LTQRRQPRHSRHRRRLQCRDHEPGRAERFRRASARKGHFPVRARRWCR
jgi:hypothetical protein